MMDHFYWQEVKMAKYISYVFKKLKMELKLKIGMNIPKKLMRLLII